MVSILGDYNYKFPKRMKLRDRLKDFLEKEVDEKYYLSDKMISYISSKGTKNYSNADCKINLDIARPLTTDQNKRGGTTNYISKNFPDNFDLNKADELLLLYNSGELDGKEFPVGCDSTINNPKVREISNCITGRYNAGIQNQQQIGMCVVENEFNIEINKYKIKNFIVEEFPTYQEYIEYFKNWYEKLMDDYYEVMIGKNNITRFFEKEPKDKTYKVEEIIEKLKEFNLYDGCKGFNGK